MQLVYKILKILFALYIIICNTLVCLNLLLIFALINNYVGAFAFTSFRSRDLMSCDSASPNRVAEEVDPTL